MFIIEYHLWVTVVPTLVVGELKPRTAALYFPGGLFEWAVVPANSGKFLIHSTHINWDGDSEGPRVGATFGKKLRCGPGEWQQVIVWTIHSACTSFAVLPAQPKERLKRFKYFFHGWAEYVHKDYDTSPSKKNWSYIMLSRDLLTSNYIVMSYNSRIPLIYVNHRGVDFSKPIRTHLLHREPEVLAPLELSVKWQI